jgi:acyl transferase domain-containing protein
LLEEFTDLNPNLDDIEVIQPMLFALQVALAALWRSGIEPAAVVGHSLGEVAAAHVAGALTLADAARVVCLRSQLLRRLRGAGGMVATELSPEAAAAFIGTYGGRVSVAAYNSSSSTVLAGEAAALDDVVAELTRRKVYCRRLIANVPSHSRGAEPLRDDLARALDGLTPTATGLLFVSSVAGRRIDGEGIDAGYWWQNLRQPVLFSPAVNELLDAGHRVFVELSPHPALLSAVQQVCDERDRATLVLRPPRDGGRCAARSPRCTVPGATFAGRSCAPARPGCLAAGVSVATRALLDRRRPRRPRPEALAHSCRTAGALGGYFRPAGSALRYWETSIDVRALPIAAQHRVTGGDGPRGGVHRTGARGHRADRRPGPRELADVEFHRALVIAEMEPRRPQLALDESSFSVRSRAGAAADDEAWTLHASGNLIRAAPAARRPTRSRASRTRDPVAASRSRLPRSTTHWRAAASSMARRCAASAKSGATTAKRLRPCSRRHPA